MKKLTLVATTLFLSLVSFGFAEAFRDYDFEQEKMLLAALQQDQAKL